MLSMTVLLFFFFRFHLFISRGRGKKGEREQEKYQCVVASYVPPNWGPGLQPKHPDWDSNQRPFSLQADAQPIETHQPQH